MTPDSSTAAFLQAVEQSRGEVNRRLREIVDGQTSAPDQIRESLGYVLLDGGKRLRPLLCLWTHDALGGEQRDACLDVASALECMHSYSLVHDDLPCMDDDDMRRGKPSCHVRFGEAIAVLTGDALLTLCFDIVSTIGSRWKIEPRVVVDATRVIARAGGSEGLITGQALDLMSDRLDANIATVERIHRYKTAALISAAMQSGAVMAGADGSVIARIAEVGEAAGRAFQIIDDVLDVEMDGETLGKTPGKDAKDGKLTYPSVSGLEPSRKRATEMIEGAKTHMAALTGKGRDRTAGNLEKLLDMLVVRSR